MEPRDFRRILIVKLSALGDVAHALPAIDYLRTAAPGAEVDWAVDRRFAPLLEGTIRLLECRLAAAAASPAVASNAATNPVTTGWFQVSRAGAPGSCLLSLKV